MPKRILIVDDNALVRQLVRRHLEAEPGFAVCEEAADGLEAISRARESKPDLVVLDLSMPHMNGLEAATVFKTKSPDIPIILFTSYKEAIPEHRFGIMGIRSVISKTSPIEVLLKEVHKLLPAVRSASA